MKYYIEYPIPIECNLRCPYCFHQQLWQHNKRYPDNQYGDKCPFTFARYKEWRDKHLADGAEFLMELHGGEMSHPKCQKVVLDIIDAADKERFQLQTNGLGPRDFYRDLLRHDRSAKIDRIGFTIHRSAPMAKAYFDCDNQGFKGFEHNIRNCRDAGIKVYVKELLILRNKDEILRSKEYWEREGIEFRIQDFKGIGGLYADESLKYTPEDWALVHPEYCHGGSSCSCREGYKQILIRGYDTFGGDVLGCWQDHKRIGSITEDWYEPYEGVKVDAAALRGRTVDGGRDYRSDYARDVQISEREQYYYNHNQRRYWMLSRLEADKERLAGMIRDAEMRIVQRDKAVAQAKAELAKAVTQTEEENAKDRQLITMAQGGVQITDEHIKWAKEPEAKAAEPIVGSEGQAAITDAADAGGDPSGDAD